MGSIHIIMSVCLKYRTLCDAVSDFKINLTLFGGMGTSNLNFELQYVQAKKEKSFIYFYFKVIFFFSSHDLSYKSSLRKI